jgi:trans-aconitate methyltransferase
MEQKTTPMHWNASLYDDKHSFVYQYGQGLLELLDPKAGEKVLDLGCGTGHLTEKIQQSGASVTGIDASPSMIAKANEAYPAVEFIVKNATEFDFSEKFDAVFSNATLHWITDAESVINNVYKSLKPGGRFVAELGGKNNVGTVLHAIQTVLREHGFAENASQQIWYFPSVATYAALLEEAGFTIRTMLYFDRDTLLQDDENGMADWINMFGDAFLKGIDENKRRQLVLEMQEAARPQCFKNGKWYGDYKRLRFIAVK